MNFGVFGAGLLLVCLSLGCNPKAGQFQRPHVKPFEPRQDDSSKVSARSTDQVINNPLDDRDETRQSRIYFACTKEASLAELRSLNAIQDSLGLRGASCEELDTVLSTTTELDLSGYRLNDLALLADQTQLIKLNLNDNLIQDVSPLESLSELRFLEFARNQVRNIEALANLGKLIQIGLSQNKISSLDSLKNLRDLRVIQASRNEITEIPSFASTKLTHLSLASNAINNLDNLSSSTSLTHLNIQANPDVSDLAPIAQLKNLIALDLQGVAASDISPISSLSLLQELSLSSTNIVDYSPLSTLSNLARFEIDAGFSLAGGDFTPAVLSASAATLTKVRIINQNLTDMSFLQNLNSLQELTLNFNPIANPEILQNLVNLKLFECIRCNLSDTSFLTNWQSLEILRLASNNLTNLTALTDRKQSITELDLSSSAIDDNLLGQLSLNLFTKLERLNLSYNPISNIGPITALNQLKELQLIAIEAENFSLLNGLTSLVRLDLSSNQFSGQGQPELSSLLDLIDLDLSGTNFNAKSDSFTNLPQLKRLSWTDGQLSNCSFLSPLTSLRQLNLSRQSLSSLICLKPLRSLEQLQVQANALTDISVLTFLGRLQVLAISANQIRDLTPLSRLSDLRDLNVTNNLIDDISPLTALPHLESFSIGSNPLGTDIVKSAENCPMTAHSDVIAVFCSEG